jgi:predicted metalloprotease with PDZ domain
MKYSFSMDNPSKQYLDITLEIERVNEESLTVQLPAWRPGRYEIANFAKNIQKFEAFGADGQPVSYHKTTKDQWVIEAADQSVITIKYNYYAAELTAGSTWLDDSQMYVNPVNCCLYVEGRESEECEVTLNVPYPFEVATGLLKKEPLVLMASDFQELADSPFIASGSLQHEDYEIDGCTFHIWFQGEIKPNWAKVQLDFERFTAKQIEAFGDFPVKEFHFLFQITTYLSYHGVEHLTSTVCQLGPSYDVMGDKYVNLLGVASHELYHVWNVKNVRPKAMLPYDFKAENYSELGYVYEGVTTYMGDKFLFSSGVFDEHQYFKEIGEYVERHLHNGGRFIRSVAESSHDTWLDGYVLGAPNRKTSIYTEGCLFSFILDVKLKTSVKSNGGLDEVMKMLYVNFGKQNIGYSKADYIEAANEIAGQDVSKLFSDLLDSAVTYEPELVWALNEIGLKLISADDKSWSKRFGIKGSYKDGKYVVGDVLMNSDADQFNLIRKDIIVAVNGIAVEGDLDKWLDYFGKGQQELGVIRNGKLGAVRIDPDFGKGYKKVTIQKQSACTEVQELNFENWLNK